MSTTLQIPGTTYTREKTLTKLGLRSRTTLVKYCQTLGIPKGLHYFTEQEFEQMKVLKNWRDRGGRFADFALTLKNLDRCA